MYKISVENDNKRPIIFLDAVTFIPGLTEGSTDADEEARDEFVDKFNKRYSSAAERKIVPIPDGKGGTAHIDCVVVCEFSEDDGEIHKMTKKEYDEFKKAVVRQWKDIFGLGSSGIKTYWPNLIKNIRITK